MRKRISKILVTGGAGFIGSAFVRLLVVRGYHPGIIDNLSYAGDLERLKEAGGRYKFYRVDICDKKAIDSVFKKERAEAVVNFAAQTHVDRSIVNATPFVGTNIAGTQVLLDISRKYKIKKFIHISTDECYGEIKRGRFNEGSPLRPNSPYAASKAAADLLIKSYVRTYGFPAVIIRPCNNYGPWQYPEKLIPVISCNALKDQRVPVYAKGLNVREWLYVQDCAEGILKVFNRGKDGEIYNLGSGKEKRNISVVKDILGLLGKSESLIRFVKDRPGHDYRYSLNWLKISRLGWKPKTDFAAGIRKTVNWYKQNLHWVEAKICNI